jgi:hypothetical protein
MGKLGLAVAAFSTISIFMYRVAYQPPVRSSIIKEATFHGEEEQARDGQEDFDFALGTWKTHIRNLQRSKDGSANWISLDGTVVIRKVWNGRADLEEIEAGGPTGHLEGLTLRLYDPQARQWNLYWANSSDGRLAQPMVGEFKNGRGDFYDQEMAAGRAVYVRNMYFDITKNSYRFDQGVSPDGGKTWQSNFTAALTRENNATAQPANTDQSTQHDFDFNFGTWKTHVMRLQHPLSSSHTWLEYDGISTVSKVWNGRASLFELEVSGPAGPIEGVGLRLYNPKSRQWSLNWASSSDGTMQPPMIGEFRNGRGEFYDEESFNGRAILVRNGFADITSNSSRFEQAFSADGAATWETNWIMTFTRIEDSPNLSP